jgi:hypothetical protein
MNNLRTGKTFWLALIAGITVGMGNGSVFGAALMCALGRGEFYAWGGWGDRAYLPTTFQGFIDWCMILFGLAFMVIMLMTLNRHGQLEKSESQEMR